MNNGQDPGRFGGSLIGGESIKEIHVGALTPQSGNILEAVLYRGEMPRAEVVNFLGLTPRHARRIVAALIERNVLTSQRPRDPLHLTFSAALASRWMPGLFPEQME